MKKYISIDIGGTAIKYGIIGEDATVFSRDETPTRAEQGGPAILQRVIDLTEALLQNPEIFGFCYTQLYDIEQEINGLYTYDRKEKFPISIIREINQQKAACEEE